MTETLVDPTVSRMKFMREVENYRKLEDEHRRRGWFLLKADFPTVHVLFTAPRLNPQAVLFAVEIDFTNYDLWAPSVRMVEPYSGKPYTHRELQSRFPFIQVRKVEPPPGPAFISMPPRFEAQDLMQASHPETPPFFCLPGVREYHQQPAHSGDSWLLHRKTGEGSLYYILEKLYVYGVEPLTGYQLGLQITGFQYQMAKP